MGEEEEESLSVNGALAASVRRERGSRGGSRGGRKSKSMDEGIERERESV